MQAVRSFIKNRRGNVTMMVGLLLPLVLATSAASVDYTNAFRIKAKTQRILDAAVLIGAKAYRESDDEDVAKNAIINYLDNMLSQAFEGSYTYEVMMTKTADPEEYVSAAKAVIEPKAWMMPERMTTVTIDAEAVVSQNDPDLLIYLLIDATGSMQSIIDAVKAAALDIETEAREAMENNETPIDKIYLKLAFVRDLRMEESRPAWIESPLYNLGEATMAQAFKSFVSSEFASDGSDLPESMPAALAHAFTAELDPGLNPDNTLVAIVAWTDAAGLPMDSPSIIDDITVQLYKTEGALDTSSRGSEHMGSPDREEYTEDSFTGGAEPNSIYGCCSTEAIFQREWERGGVVKLDSRVMAIMAPLSQEPWAEMRTWPNVVMREYTTPSAAGVIDDIVSATITQFEPMRISR